MRTMKVILALAVLLVFSFGLFYAFSSDEHWEAPPEAKSVKNPVKPTEESIKRGKEIYQKKCLMCHGEKGDGSGPVAKQLKTPPGDLRDAKMMQEMTDGELFWKITNGRDPMPRFEKMLSDDERWHVVNYVRTLSSQGGAQTNSGTKPDSSTKKEKH